MQNLISKQKRNNKVLYEIEITVYLLLHMELLFLLPFHLFDAFKLFLGYFSLYFD